MRTESRHLGAVAQRRTLWHWAILDEFGLLIESGQTGDEASAMRHARRSGLQCLQTYKIQISARTHSAPALRRRFS